MIIRGIIQSSELREDPPDSGRIDMVIRVQGVGRDQPRRLVIPMDRLLENPGLDPESMPGHGFEAEVEERPDQKWVVTRICIADKDLLGRPPE